MRQSDESIGDSANWLSQPYQQLDELDFSLDGEDLADTESWLARDGVLHWAQSLGFNDASLGLLGEQFSATADTTDVVMLDAIDSVISSVEQSRTQSPDQGEKICYGMVRNCTVAI